MAVKNDTPASTSERASSPPSATITGLGTTSTISSTVCVTGEPAPGSSSTRSSVAGRVSSSNVASGVSNAPVAVSVNAAATEAGSVWLATPLPIASAGAAAGTQTAPRRGLLLGGPGRRGLSRLLGHDLPGLRRGLAGRGGWLRRHDVPRRLILVGDLLLLQRLLELLLRLDRLRPAGRRLRGRLLQRPAPRPSPSGPSARARRPGVRAQARSSQACPPRRALHWSRRDPPPPPKGRAQQAQAPAVLFRAGAKARTSQLLCRQLLAFSVRAARSGLERSSSPTE